MRASAKPTGPTPPRGEPPRGHPTAPEAAGATTEDDHRGPPPRRRVRDMVLALCAVHALGRAPSSPIDIELDKLITVVQDEGIPLVWVPREEIVAELLRAEDRPARAGCCFSTSTSWSMTAGPCSTAWHRDRWRTSGISPCHRRPSTTSAQALAVLVTETAVARTLGPKYPRVKKQVLFDRTVSFAALRFRAALAPIGSFYQAVAPTIRRAAARALSRHVTVHQATSVLRGLQEYRELLAAAREHRRA